MKKLAMLAIALGGLALSGCAAGYSQDLSRTSYPKYWGDYTAPGQIPPSWYDYDPSIGQRFQPWYVNPYQQ